MKTRGYAWILAALDVMAADIGPHMREQDLGKTDAELLPGKI